MKIDENMQFMGSISLKTETEQAQSISAVKYLDILGSIFANTTYHNEWFQ